MEYPHSFEELVECFKMLPGIGTKGAERLVYHVLSMDFEQVERFSDALLNLKRTFTIAKNVDIYAKVIFVKYVKIPQEIRQQSVLLNRLKMSLQWRNSKNIMVYIMFYMGQFLLWMGKQ